MTVDIIFQEIRAYILILSPIKLLRQAFQQPTFFRLLKSFILITTGWAREPYCCFETQLNSWYESTI